MSKIVCNINMFDLNQHIILVKDNGTSEEITTSTINNLGDLIVASCSKFNLNKIHLFGDKKYIDGIIENILSINSSKYKINNIELEVN